jgi:hypothetical protein
MFKLPKSEIKAGFKELAVKREKTGLTIAAVAQELGMVEQTLRSGVLLPDEPIGVSSRRSSRTSGG